ncbi:hypothetical protein Sipo8835_11030 [Streptomyces ipomoeae]|uniref:Uncharacterized protein n=2 Tax=Streptomyces ipomoeae TaxID=103232 RepID=L1L6B3_9ACTN|nr:hypothetical protein [Streptomyces ipomoeae]EKX68457.1 hypothetical protein STRIP9103_07514 [Streptomyces ipomoeae 91-03]MDX2692102.1 hypothetical protein [Streptomyces ipomoeae]MDX2820429.1 hypothetical protein [Streptomyces ipomoeae]MDX2837477.1 hypothetical protein [Streptomyces ipomoeae]MDX2874035.1 hypothetical protein [Streptomyces ipomoeae]
MDTDTGARPLLLDRALPDFRFTRLECATVAAGPPQTYRTARDLDLLSIHSPLFDLVARARGLPDRLRGNPASPPASMRLADLFDTVTEGRHDQEQREYEQEQPWVGLGEDPGRELVFGAVGKAWQPSIQWRRIEPGEFPEFAEPGWAKIAAALVVHPYGTRRSLLTYEARTACTDPVATRRFARYWTVVSPDVGIVMRAALHAIRTTAEEEARSATGAPGTVANGA